MCMWARACWAVSKIGATAAASRPGPAVGEQGVALSTGFAADAVATGSARARAAADATVETTKDRRWGAKGVTMTDQASSEPSEPSPPPPSPGLSDSQISLHDGQTGYFFGSRE